MNRRIAAWTALLGTHRLGFALLGALLLGIGAPLRAGVMSEEAALGLDGTPVPGAPPASMGWNTAKGAFDRVVWNRTPIRVLLPVGRERRLDFPAPVSAGLPAGALPAGALRVQSTDGSLYLLASEPFAPVRMQVREEASGFVYLLDVAARKDGTAKTLVIMRGSNTPSTAAVATPQRPAGSDPYIRLTRYAAQQLYGPERMVRPEAEIARVPVPRKALKLLRGGGVKATPLVSWSGYGHYVTAVKLVNTTKRAVELDPRSLRGPWLSATFQHGRLFPAGDSADTSVVYLITRQPFTDTLPSWLRVAAKGGR